MDSSYQNSVLDKLGYNGVLVPTQEIYATYPDYRDICQLGADYCYFIDKNPAVLFHHVSSFNNISQTQISEILHKAWNYRKVLFLIVYSSFEVRAYNCFTKPEYTKNKEDYNSYNKRATIKEAFLSETDSFNEFLSLFSRISVDCGAIWQQESNVIQTINLENRVDAYLVNSLDRTAAHLKKVGLRNDIIHSLLIRSLFILFLEDKGAAAEAGLYEKIKNGCQSYFDILKNKEATYKLFQELNTHFYGDITPIIEDEYKYVTSDHLEIIRRCFLDGDLSDTPKLYDDWRLFRFDIIRIELLSEIYEHFLGASKKDNGQFYTPHNLVDLVLSEKIPTCSKSWNIRILDPACGSGIFLVESYKRLIQIWKRENPAREIDYNTLCNILCNNIYGIEIDLTALKVAAFSLYLTLINELNPKTLWIQPECPLPFLIATSRSASLEKGHNLWCADTIDYDFSNVIPEVDLLIGNPPYGTKHNQSSISQYCKKHSFADEMVLPFMHKAIQFCPKGEIALIFNIKILTNTNGTYKNFREWLFSKTYVKSIYNFSIFRKSPKNYGGSLFSSATAPVAVIYYSANIPNIKSDTIQYWAPRTYVKSNVLTSIILDGADMKYLPREECEKGNTTIWKIGAWGNFDCFRLISRLKELPTLKEYFKKNDWIYGRGSNADSKHPDITPSHIVDLKRISRYHISSDAIIANNSQKAFRRNKDGLFNPPYVIVKECPDNNGVIAGIYNGPSSIITSTSTFVFKTSSYLDQVILTTYLNSKLVNCILFLTSSTWGIERERLLLDDEVALLPSPFDLLNKESSKTLTNLYNKIFENNSQILIEDTHDIQESIDDIFYRIFNLSERDIELIEDTFIYAVELFAYQAKSSALSRTTIDDLTAYASRLCKCLNELFQFSSYKVSATIYKFSISAPLSVIEVSFSESILDTTIKENLEFQSILRRLYNTINHQITSDIQIRRQLIFYDNNKIYIVKPNQKRHWTIVQASDDADTLFHDILRMGDDDNE